MQVSKFILVLIFTLTVKLFAYSQPYYFRHYEVESGLSNNAVICSAQDKLGFMWFGTRDGLNRFDGYRFKVYRFPENNLIHSMHIDEFGTLLVGTEKAIYKYNAKSDSFLLLLISANYPIDEIISDRKGNIWFNANNVLSKYSEKNKKLKTYPIKKFSPVSSIALNRKGVLWIGTADGLLKRYDYITDSFTSFNLYSHSSKTESRYINNILCTPDDKILVGTDKGGFKIFDISSNTYKDIVLCCEKTDNLFIRCFLQISSTELWIGSETGIFNYNTQTGTSFKIQKNSADAYAISDNVVYTLFKDKEGGIWAGTYFGGINYYPKQYTPFKKFYRQSSNNPLSGNIVREITEDNFGNIWIGTEDGGLNKLDSKTGKIVYYKPDNTSSSISYICVHSLLPEGDELWVGTFHHGLDIFNIKTGKVTRKYNESSKNGFKSNFPFCLLKTNEQEIIVGAFPGLYTYKRNGNYFSAVPHFPTDEQYKCLLKDSNGTLWAGIAGKGVLYHNTKMGITGHYAFNPLDKKSISSDMINSIFEDSKKNLWFATENGLCKLNKANNGFIRYDVSTGLPSNFILSILEDEQGRLWISTTKGLVCFDTQKNKISTYTTANGLLSNQFNFSSAYKDKNNKMYFGSAKGLISFSTKDFIVDTFIPPVYLTGLQIDNKEINNTSNNSPLQQSIIYTDKITLNHNQSTFSLDFAALGYTAPQDLQYAYKLEGLSNKWTYVKRDQKANFTKLAPGLYTFKVKAASTAGIWSNKETTITIDVLPPWWLSIWAYTVYFILAVMIIYLLFYYYNKRIQEKNKRKIERLEIAREKELLQMEIAKEKEMLDAKIEFYTQVAHEIRTPLTLIKIPLGKVIRKTEGIDEIKNSLKIIGGNTDRLIELSNQLLDFRQTELKAYSHSFERTNISELLSDAHQNFMTLADYSNINLTLEMPSKKLFALVDVDVFTKIIYNLLSNAVKYAATTVNIILHPHYPDSHNFTITIKNDGYLIPEHLREKVFEPFFRIKETETKTGSGIGLALARSLALTHNGTLVLENPEQGKNVFTLTLPINNLE